MSRMKTTGTAGEVELGRGQAERGGKDMPDEGAGTGWTRGKGKAGLGRGSKRDEQGGLQKLS